MTIAKIIAGLVSLFNALATWLAREQAKADGAAIQRDQDMRAENAKVAKADRARDDVRNGGGVRIEDDPWNRANRK